MKLKVSFIYLPYPMHSSLIHYASLSCFSSFASLSAGNDEYDGNLIAEAIEKNWP